MRTAHEPLRPLDRHGRRRRPTHTARPSSRPRRAPDTDGGDLGGHLKLLGAVPWTWRSHLPPPAVAQPPASSLAQPLALGPRRATAMWTLSWPLAQRQVGLAQTKHVWCHVALFGAGGQRRRLAANFLAGSLREPPRSTVVVGWTCRPRPSPYRAIGSQQSPASLEVAPGPVSRKQPLARASSDTQTAEWYEWKPSSRRRECPALPLSSGCKSRCGPSDAHASHSWDLVRGGLEESSRAEDILGLHDMASPPVCRHRPALATY